MSTALHSQTARLTVDDVMEMLRTGALHEDDRVELLEGRLVVISPKSGAHSGGVWLLQHLLGKEYGEDHVRAEQPIHVDDYSEPEPDISVSRVSNEVLYTDNRHPTVDECILVAEVAYSSQDRDRNKALFYSVCGIPVYWLVDLLTGIVTVYSEPTPTGYASVQPYRMVDGVPLPDRSASIDLTRMVR